MNPEATVYDWKEYKKKNWWIERKQVQILYRPSAKLDVLILLP